MYYALHAMHFLWQEMLPEENVWSYSGSFMFGNYSMHLWKISLLHMLSINSHSPPISLQDQSKFTHAPWYVGLTFGNKVQRH